MLPTSEPTSEGRQVYCLFHARHASCFSYYWLYKHIMFPVFCLVFFLWAGVEFSYNTQGRAVAFSQTHIAISVHSHTTSSLSSCRWKTGNKKLEWACWFLSFVCFWYNEKLFLTVLTCPPRMMLWTKRVFGWKIAESDCETLRTWNTGSVDAKVWQQW